MLRQRIINTKIILSIELQKIFKSHLVEMISAALLFLILIKRGNSVMEYVNNALLFLSAVIGLVGFGILASWVFSREFTDGTFKDLLALPISRSTIIIGKLVAIEITELFITFISTVLIIVVGHLTIGEPLTKTIVAGLIGKIWKIVAYNVLLSFLWPLVASLSRSALLPMSLSFISLILAVIFSSQPIGRFIPWSITGYWLANPTFNPLISNLIVSAVAAIGIYGTMYVWNYLDQS